MQSCYNQDYGDKHRNMWTAATGEKNTYLNRGLCPEVASNLTDDSFRVDKRKKLTQMCIPLMDLDCHTMPRVWRKDQLMMKHWVIWSIRNNLYHQIFWSRDGVQTASHQLKWELGLDWECPQLTCTDMLYRTLLSESESFQRSNNVFQVLPSCLVSP